MVIIRAWRGEREAEGARRTITAIFWATAATTAFPSDDARAAYQHRWLDRYLDRWPDWAWIAERTGESLPAIVGYLIACPNSAANGETIPAFAALAPQYPAHLHINIAPDQQSQGVGARLITAHLAQCLDEGLAGSHLITAADARNVRFYTRAGFSEVARAETPGRTLVMLGRTLVRQV